MRRERYAIIGAILHEIDRERAKGDEARITNVALRANLSYDRLLAYVDKLVAAGLVVAEGRMPALTQKGREFLTHYRQWLSVLDRFGVDQI